MNISINIPEGYEFVAFRMPEAGELHVDGYGNVKIVHNPVRFDLVIVKEKAWYPEKDEVIYAVDLVNGYRKMFWVDTPEQKKAFDNGLIFRTGNSATAKSLSLLDSSEPKKWVPKHGEDVYIVEPSYRCVAWLGSEQQRAAYGAGLVFKDRNSAADKVLGWS